VCLRDALDERKAQAGARVVAVDAFSAPDERLDKRRNQLRSELLTGILDRQRHGLWLDACLDPDAALSSQVMDDGVVHEVRRQLEEQRG
jgi:hypothetical protein